MRRLFAFAVLAICTSAAFAQTDRSSGKVDDRTSTIRRENTISGPDMEFEEEAEPCATPTITVKNGEITFSCETANALIHYTYALTSAREGSGTGTTLTLPNTYTITAYATADGYRQSAKASKTVSLTPGDLNGDGKTTIQDVTLLVDKLIKKK